MKPTPATIFSGLLQTARSSKRHIVADDMLHKPLSMHMFLTKTLVLASALKPKLAGAPNVGMLLPTSIGGMVAFFALQALGKVPAMLNFTAGEKALKAAIDMAQVQVVLTSRTFIEKGELQALVEFLGQHVQLIYLEDLKPEIGFGMKLSAMLKASFTGLIRLPDTKPKDVATILFTSGSEGLPKGVALSHMNVLANIAQVKERLQFSRSDCLFNALPIFHSFGLTVGTVLPVILGLRVYCYPTPLHYKIIPKQIRESKATIIVATDTFFKGYAHYAESEHFSGLRLLVAGAEKLKNSTFELYQQRFGKTIYQGYGVTETAPVLSCNTPDAHKIGSVGKLFPMIDGRLEPVEGITEGGKLLVRGPNVMLGYMKADAPGVVQPQGEWYDTGDIVTVDAEGFVTIIGRAKRFAKLGGEMVSLAAVEDLAAQADSEVAHAAIAIADESKGEKIILFTESKTLTRELLVQTAAKLGVAELAIPKLLKAVDAIPRLGNGKIDYPALTTLHNTV